METVKYQIFVFLYTIYGGIIIGISYDIYIVIKGKSKKDKSRPSLWDIVFLILVLFIFLWAIFSSNYGDRRVYAFIGFIVGFALYEKVLGKFGMHLFTIVKKNVVRLFTTTNHLLLLPFRFIYNILWYPVLKTIKKIKGFFKGFRKLRKIPKIFINDTKKYYRLIIKKQIKNKK